MRSAQPPTTATWLLEHLSSGPSNDSLKGDLMEEYRSGRSGAWYWRQVLMTIAVSFWKEISAHKLLAVRAVATGWAVWYLYGLFIGPWVYKLLIPFAQELPLAFKFGPYSGFAWWIIWLSVSAAIGWIVGRSHREHQTAMVLIFTASVLLWNLRRLPWIVSSLVVDAIGDSRYAPYIVSNLASVLLPPVCILIGGLWNTPPKITAPIHEKKVAT
jgi:hypothetical protein